jgi:hypothetical protein
MAVGVLQEEAMFVVRLLVQEVEVLPTSPFLGSVDARGVLLVLLSVNPIQDSLMSRHGGGAVKEGASSPLGLGFVPQVSNWNEDSRLPNPSQGQGFSLMHRSMPTPPPEVWTSLQRWWG